MIATSAIEGEMNLILKNEYNYYMDVKEWLDKNEWPDKAIESDAYSHYTFMSEIMVKFAKEYHVHKLESAKKKEAVTIKKFI